LVEAAAYFPVLDLFIAPDSWGYCPDNLIKKPAECFENYYAVENLCLRYIMSI
jgi:hypothetical protein